MSITDIIDEAIAVAGSQGKLAGRSGLSQQHISKIRNGQRRITAEAAVAIESATDGQVNRTRLRPDLWPPVLHSTSS